MAISVTVPKDLSNIQDKVVFNLTKRQVICFAAAAAIGVPLYLFTKEPLGSEVAVLLMVIVMMPAFFMAMYRKNGFPAEKIAYFMIRQKILMPGVRPYRSENLLKKLEQREKYRKEVEYLERKAGGRKTGADIWRKKKTAAVKKDTGRK